MPVYPECWFEDDDSPQLSMCAECDKPLISVDELELGVCDCCQEQLFRGDRT